MVTKEQIEAFKKAGESVFNKLALYEEHQVAVITAESNATEAAAKKSAADDAVQQAKVTRDDSLNALRAAEAARRNLFDQTFGPIDAPANGSAAI
jgi:hypothetical protein